MDSKNRPKVSCDLIVEKNGKILMGKRGNIAGRGEWAFPGGHLEFGEMVEEGARRELKEETGLIPIEMQLLGILNDFSLVKEQVNHYIRFVFKVSDFEGKLQNEEPEKCEGWKWFGKGSLPTPVFFGHAKIVDVFVKNKKDTNNVFFDG